MLGCRDSTEPSIPRMLEHFKDGPELKTKLLIFFAIGVLFRSGSLKVNFSDSCTVYARVCLSVFDVGL